MSDDRGTGPPRVICAGGHALRPERWSPWRHGAWSCRITVINADGTPVEGATVTIGPPGRMFHYCYLDRRRWSGCPLCNPRGNPARLCIDGQEYARRRKARRRRR